MRFSPLHALTMATISIAAAQGGSPVAAKTLAACRAEYAANKAAIRASGQKKAAFVAACRTEAETAPAAPDPGAPPPPADPMAPKPMFPMPTASPPKS